MYVHVATKRWRVLQDEFVHAKWQGQVMQLNAIAFVRVTAHTTQSTVKPRAVYHTLRPKSICVLNEKEEVEKVVVPGWCMQRLQIFCLW